MDVIGPMVVIATATLLLTLLWRLRDGPDSVDRDSEGKGNPIALRLEERLEADFSHPRSHLETPPTIQTLSTVDTTDDGEPIYVPTVRIDLGTTDAPGLELVFEFVASVLETLHPVLEDETVHVRQYDVQFTFGPDGLFVSGECRQISVPASMATRLVSEDRYRALELQRDVKRGVERDDERNGSVAPELWDEC